MKALLFFALAFILALAACSKSNHNSSIIYDYTGTTKWQLVQKTWSAGASFWIVAPAKDSSVVLALNSDNTYESLLNGKTISQGGYTITTDTVPYHQQVLQLNNFKQTGIFRLFLLDQVGTNGQVLSRFDGLYMHTSHDSLTLFSPLTPGGNTSYLFVKK